MCAWQTAAFHNLLNQLEASMLPEDTLRIPVMVNRIVESYSRGADEPGCIQCGSTALEEDRCIDCGADPCFELDPPTVAYDTREEYALDRVIDHLNMSEEF